MEDTLKKAHIRHLTVKHALHSFFHPVVYLTTNPYILPKLVRAI